jgi:transposase
MRRGLFWFSDARWRRVAPHLPTNLRGPARDDDRRVISGVVHMLQSGAH